jgi:shikimate dehydrogenase
MRQYGLLGYPLSHSFSKVYFTEKFRNEGIDALYDTFPIPDIREFPSLIDSMPALAGMNVTIPYKQAVIPFLDDLDPEAREVGAVNVIRFEPSVSGKFRLIGFNSDLYGFRESIRPLIGQLLQRLTKAAEELETGSPCLVPPTRSSIGLPGFDSSIPPLKALVFGTGGASKAVLYGLKQLNIETLLVSRTAANGQITYEELTSRHLQEYRILLNTTPLGMFPNVDTCPKLDYSALGSNHLLFDVVYNPDKTLFLRKGEQQGCIISNGLEMLHLQAEAAWAIWNLHETGSPVEP